MCENSKAGGALSILTASGGFFRNTRHDTDHVVQINDIARFDVAGHGFAANPGKTDLALWIVRINEVHVERDLTVNAHRLDLRDLHRPRAFQHVDTLEHRPSYARALPRVSGIHFQVSAARRKANDEIDNAVPNPCVCASVPTANGAAALTIRPTL